MDQPLEDFETDRKPHAAGDFRGAYGYGRPAHRPDPDAVYSFEPQWRTLPLDKRWRWTVSG